MATRFLNRLKEMMPASPLLLVAPLFLLLAAGFWIQQPSPPDRSNHSQMRSYQDSHSVANQPTNDADRQGPPPREGDRRDGRRDGRRGDHRGGGRHHGPPHGPCVPPTVLFLVGGALGYLIGTRRRHCGPRSGRWGQPPAPPEAAAG